MCPFYQFKVIEFSLPQSLSLCHSLSQRKGDKNTNLRLTWWLERKITPQIQLTHSGEFLFNLLNPAVFFARLSNMSPT